ncbi:DNA-binding transcriptional regulator, GntR family [Poseidonocella pacifica]|uniref:DNA-binding transcriptional regulator, GntR family n=1 Tax=Poseidonocella pacifica TaxID=871651 RepID=A0A1I0X3T1_9RHOB|nr:GntR family transcriptional regulator [Poseidonocella pacifica]SFA95689.1 DNA-binding transcriptional regulator, GntR family [Poseidonocella pacifica]
MSKVATLPEDRRNIVDDIAEYLYREITSMRLLPGTRISETDIAAQFGVSRQPVRDAFRRLESMELILVRPKRATEVRKFSIQAIEKSRFVRASIEAAALRKAAEHCDVAGGFQLDSCIALQQKALAERDFGAFGALDYDFHRAICEIGRVPYAFEVIKAEKEKVDRLCILGLAKEQRMPELIRDHEEIARAIKAGDAEAAVAAGMRHLSRLDDTIAAIRVNSAAYFADDET